MSTHNLCFQREIRKTQHFSVEKKSASSEALIKVQRFKGNTHKYTIFFTHIFLHSLFHKSQRFG